MLLVMALAALLLVAFFSLAGKSREGLIGLATICATVTAVYSLVVSIFLYHSNDRASLQDATFELMGRWNEPQYIAAKLAAEGQADLLDPLLLKESLYHAREYLTYVAACLDAGRVDQPLLKRLGWDSYRRIAEQLEKSEIRDHATVTAALSQHFK